MTQSLEQYRQKRDFATSPEPRGDVRRKGGRLYVIQKHAARRLHYDFRLELGGVLMSWAVTRGPSLDPSQKRLAVRTEDHPVEYGDFEGTIPNGYGAGRVMLWDRGTWEPEADEPESGLKAGILKFRLQGERLKGGFTLVRLEPEGRKSRENWLLIKKRDEAATSAFDPTAAWTTSIVSGLDIEEIDQKASTARPDTRGTRSKKASKARVAFVPLQLATPAETTPKGEGWLHEIKYDGYRLEAVIGAGNIRLLTRNKKDWSHRYPGICGALSGLRVDNAVIDGELVALNDRGQSDFSALQNAHEVQTSRLRYYAFDLLLLNGEDLRQRPLVERKSRLRWLLTGVREPVAWSRHVEGNAEGILTEACALGLEGIVSKRASSPYRAGRGTSWIKAKCVNNQEFVLGGFRRSDKRGRPFASLLVGEYVAGRLEYRGRVGTGFDSKTMDRLHRLMMPLVRKSCPFADVPAAAKRDAVWLTPQLAVQIAYLEQTPGGRLRHPKFLGIREDKHAREVKALSDTQTSQSAKIGGVRITHPDRIMYPQQGGTKRAIAEYYLDIADELLPYLKNRPLSLVRCPKGRGDQCFFQKHHNGSVPEHIGRIDIEEKDGKPAPYLVIRSAKGLVAATQMSALELHIWGARTDDIERPDRLVFDLDPDADLPFKVVRDAALQIHDLLAAADLDSFPLITGGKGIHVVVPLARRRGWNDIKVFARGFARKVRAAAPDLYVAEAAKAKRTRRIFIDWLRNQRGATAVAPYSVRARKGAPVAAPVSWRELQRITRANQFDLGNIRARMASLCGDPWDGYDQVRQSITNNHLAFAASS